MNRAISILLIGICTLMNGEQLYFEDFSSGLWPAGWVREGNWQIGNGGSAQEGNDTPPAAYYNWSPQQYNFEHNLVSPPIDVGENTSVLIEFYFALDFWADGDLNGLSISYDGGEGWQEVLNYAIGPGLEIQNNPWASIESFTADVLDGSDLKLRWTAYGVDSWAIDGWMVDNIKILTLPQMESVSIASTNEDPATATAGTDISLNFSSDSDLTGAPYVQINGNVCNVENLGGRNWVASYIVQEIDLDGPIQFTIDFTDVNDIDGKTVRQTTDNSVVIVDNSDPPTFGVGNLTATGGNIFNGIWNSTNTGLELDVNVPQDSSVVNFNFTPGTSISFNGTSDQVIIDGNSEYQASTSLTIEAWVKPLSTPSDYDGFLSYSMDANGTRAGFGFCFYLTGWKFFLVTADGSYLTGDPGEEVFNYAAMAGAQLPINQWTHIAATYNGSQVKLYRNGSEVDANDNNVEGSIIWEGAPMEMVLGNFPREGQGHYFDGKLDEIRIWNIVRTENEIKASKEIALLGDEDGLVGYWMLDEGSGNSSENLSIIGETATLSGATWSENDSPLDFQTPVYDTGVIVGSAFQLAGRIVANEFELFGQKDTITIGDFNNGSKVVSAPEESFESINSFSHEQTAQVSAFLFDPAGNFTQGDVASTAFVIDIIAENPNSISMVSNNTFNHLAKTGDVVTATIGYGEDVNLPIITIDGNNAEESDLGDEQFQAVYTLLGTEPEGLINTLQSMTTDYLGNEGTYNGGSIGEGATTVFYDRTLPTLDLVTISSNNALTQWAKVGDQVTINSHASEPVLTRAATIQTQTANITDVNISEFNSVYQFTESDSEGLVTFNLIISDSAGNVGEGVNSTTNSSWVVFDKTSPSDFNTGAVSSTGGNEVVDIWNSTNTGINILVPVVDNDTTIINGKTKVMAKIGLNSWEQVGDYFTINEGDIGTDKSLLFSSFQVESITGFAENDTITFKAVLQDRAGNEKEGTASTNRLVIEQTPPSINYSSYRSNFSDTTLATVGHEITLTFKTNEPIQEPAVMISSQSAETNDLGNNKWVSTYTMQEGDDQGVILFDTGEILDIAGNPDNGSTSTTDGSTVTFDNTKPTLNVVRISSSNSDSTWAKIGDTVSIIFIADELLTAQTANMFGEPMVISDLGSEKYLAQYEMTEFDTEGQIEFEILVTDTVGINSEPITETTNSSLVVFDKTLPILDQVNIQSNNENNNSIAITGDDVILTFTPEEPLLPDSIIATIANENVTLVESGNSFIATLTLSGDEPGGILPFTIDFLDRASNRGIQVTNSTDNSYVNHDIVPPEILTASIYSNNEDTTWSKLGDIVYVKFSANEALDNLDILIAGNIPEVIDDGGANYRAYHTMDADDEEGIINFSIDYTDLGGAVGPSANATTDETTVRYDRTLPQLTGVRVSSNNAMIDSAAIGDIDSLFFTSSEAQRNVSVTIADSNVVPIQNLSDFTGTRELFDEDPDGIVSFSITLEDSAGNSTGDIIETNDGSFVWFDGTRPTLNTVSFISTNSNDSSLAIIGDTLILDFEPSETLGSITITIADTDVDTIFINELPSAYRSWYILQGSEAEGYVPFQICFTDLVGNAGDCINSTTDESNILFDITAPDEFVVDTVYVLGGNVKREYWNASNDSIVLKTPISLDDESLIGGSYQPMIKFNNEEYINFGSEIPIINIPESGYEYLKIFRDVLVSTEGYAENSNAQFTTKIIDKAGNETLGSSDGTIMHIDEILPILNTINIVSNNILSENWATVSDTISLSIASSEGLDVVTMIMVNDTMPANGSQNGTSQIAKYIVDSSDPEGLVIFDIAYSDTAGNEGINISETTDGTVVGIDNSNPSINNILEGADNSDPSYYNNSDTITIYWTQEDGISGIRETYYGIGSEPNITDVRDWTLGTPVNYGGWNSLALSNDNVYYGAAFVRDSAGNYSDTIWGNGVYIDTELPSVGNIEDGQWILEMDYTPDSTSLKYSWEGFDDNIGIDHYQLSIGTGNDTTNIQDWYETDSLNSVTITGLDLDRDTLYLTYIKAVDSAYNLSSIVNTDGIYFDDSEPKVLEISPDFSDSSSVLSVLSNDSIKIKFNRLLYFYDMKVTSSADSNFVTEESYSDSVITIKWNDTLLSNDTLIVYLDSALAYNSLFVTDTLYFFSHLWGDLNYDYDLTVEDILEFNRSWPETDLGPFSGYPPHVRPDLDGESNLMDLSAFAKMWQWRYFNLSFNTTNVARIGGDLKIKGKGSNVIINVPENTSMAEILIGNANVDIEKIRLMNQASSTFYFKSIDSLNQMVQFSIAGHRGLDSILTLKVPESNSNMFASTIQYTFLDSEGYEINQGISNLEIDMLPERFTVYKNYPNPFNPITTIRYDLPEVRDVQISIIDLTGRIIVSTDLKDHKAGRHTYVWNGVNKSGKKVSTGMYFFILTAGLETNKQKMLLLK